MAAVSPHSHKAPFTDFDQAVEQRLGADMRLIYGLGVPILLVIGLILLLALTPATWLVVAILLFEVAALGVIVTGIFGMLDDEGDEGDEPEGL